MHIDNVIFLILSKIAYTKFSEGPMVTTKLFLVTLFIVSLALKTSKAIRNLFNAIRYLFAV